MRRKDTDIVPVRDAARKLFARYPKWTPDRYHNFINAGGKSVTKRTLYRWLKAHRAEETQEAP